MRSVRTAGAAAPCGVYYIADMRDVYSDGCACEKTSHRHHADNNCCTCLSVTAPTEIFDEKNVRSNQKSYRRSPRCIAQRWYYFIVFFDGTYVYEYTETMYITSILCTDKDETKSNLGNNTLTIENV